MTVLANTAEGGTDGVTLTAGNTGGASGDAFQGFGGTPTFSNLHPATGTMGFRLDNDADRFAWENLTQTTLYGRAYLYFATMPSIYIQLFEFLDSGYANDRGRIDVNDAGNILLRDAALVTQATSSTALTTGVLYRLEFKVVSHASAGSLECRLFTGHSSTASETLSVSSINTNGGAIQVNRRYLNGTGDVFLDDLNINDVDFPGPSSLNGVWFVP